MTRIDDRCSGNARSRRGRTLCPTLEGLEDRLLLATSDGGHWTYSSRITYSLMPDGTNVAGVSSNLFQTLNAYYPTATWQQTIERSAAIWQASSNTNLALVSDDGSPVSTSGNQQDDSRFGDIRIGAIPLPGGTLGEAFLPPPVNGGTDAGDILLNSNVNWSSGGYDLETVVLHELGHALGLGHSTASGSVMNQSYTVARSVLAADDISGIQAIYGAPGASASNTTWQTATDLTSMLNSQAQLTLSGQYVNSPTNTDWFKVTVPLLSVPVMTVTMTSANLSSLSPRLAVYLGTGGSPIGLGQASVANNFGGTVTFTVLGVLPGQTYYFRASPANSSGGGTDGAYGLGVNLGLSAQIPPAAPNTVVASQADQGGGTTNLESFDEVLKSAHVHGQVHTAKVGHAHRFAHALIFGRKHPTGI